MTTDTQTRILHSAYQRLTGLDLPYTMRGHFMWENWSANGFGSEDLRLVVAHIKTFYREAPKIMAVSLRFSKLIGDTETFSELLAEAKARGRVRPETNRQAVLRATGRKSEEDPPVRSAAQVMRDEAAFQRFREATRGL